MQRWLFIPIDDRPITSRFPVRIAPLGGIDLLAPPRPLLGRYLTPGEPDAIARWALEQAPGCRGAIVSLEMLAYGGLIASREPAVPLAEAGRRLAMLRELKRQGLTIYASNVIMRNSITVSGPEQFEHYRLIQEWSAAAALPDDTRAAELARRIPPDLLARYRGARHRNHQVNRLAVDLVAEGVIDFLLLLQEDCSPTGLHRQEQAALQQQIALRGVQNRALILPGTDEGALLLLARAALHQQGGPPPVLVPIYGHPHTADLPAPYEDRPLRETVALQVQAAGARLGGNDHLGPDVIRLFVHTPEEAYGDLALVPPAPEPASDGNPKLVAAIGACLAAGCPAAVADVAYANGADPRFTEKLLELPDWTGLWGYAAWNTAGNTLGTAVAMAILRALDGGADALRHQQALVERLVDDYGYQSRVRPGLMPLLEAGGWNPWQLGEGHGPVSEAVARRLEPLAREIVRSGPARHGYRLARFGARLPWPRIFEVEIDVELVQG
ncbi:MAG: DUF4127 family protein [Bacillota bacterium]